MPRKYIRKQNIKARASWSEDNLQMAMEKVRQKELGVNEASKQYNIPSRTLRRRLSLNDSKKKPLGKPPALRAENEERLVRHIKKLQSLGFAPTRLQVREIAYNFAKKLNLEKHFSQRGDHTNAAGMHWFYSFMERHPDLAVRKSEGLSLARAKGLNREEVHHFYNLLKSTLEELNLIDKPQSIYNMDESGIQINNKPDQVIAEKGSKCVHALTSYERGENISIVACTNAEGNFLPPVLILKGVRKNVSTLEGMPIGSALYMNKKSSFINSDLFLKWMKEIFVPRKVAGPVILLLDGHGSHCTNVDMLEYAEQHDITLLCLPSHTTQALQPLDRSFFKSLKSAYKREADKYLFASQSKQINRHVIGKLIGPSWNKAATKQNAASGFSATGIYPFNRDAIPDYFFQISDNAEANEAQAEQITQPVVYNIEEIDNVELQDLDRDYDISDNRNDLSNGETTLSLEEEIKLAEMLFEDEDLKNTKSEKQSIQTALLSSSQTKNMITEPVAHCSKTSINIIENVRIFPVSTPTKVAHNPLKRKPAEAVGHCSKDNSKDTEETPSKFLEEIAPLTTIPLKKSKRKQSAKILSSGNVRQNKMNSKTQVKAQTNKKKNRKKEEDEDNVNCLECSENYYQTTETVDWIKCVACHKWLHETCTMYNPMCNDCGRIKKRQEKEKPVSRNIFK